jgi:hypothetical protein
MPLVLPGLPIEQATTTGALPEAALQLSAGVEALVELLRLGGAGRREHAPAPDVAELVRPPDVAVVLR